MTGIERIAAERERQIKVEAWTPEHDDGHKSAELTNAATAYAEVAAMQMYVDAETPSLDAVPDCWPWKIEYWKPADDPVRNLEKAGALIAAEIDRLLRLHKTRERADAGINILDQIAEAAGGQAQLHVFKNESGEVVHAFGTMSFPLPKTHWIYQKDDTPAGFQSNVPPMPFRMPAKSAVYLCIDTEDIGSLIKSGQQRLPALKLNRRQLEKAIRAAGKYAVRCATMNGSDMDFDPDALLQNLVVGMLGYWTETGFTGDPEDSVWCDPQAPFDFTEPPPRNFPSGDIGQGCATSGGSDPIANPPA